MLAVTTGIPSFDSERIAPDAGGSWIRVRGFTPRASHGRNTDLGLGVGSHGAKNRRVRYLFPKSTRGFGPPRVAAWNGLFQVGREPDFLVAERLRDHLGDTHRPGRIEMGVVVTEELADRPGG